ncbi:MAG: ABC transporter permease [Anaerolineales bacterium]|uniref:ABC transporter permease n=1 Tax=Candidatus Villigracilis affinis TaxID=3140682 RepID=UPI001DF359C6|nr:ABC transporter permease [Anaerolineales bacterium]MBK9601009.1 ABC transporter permease [Anaerolineales bacterium]MBL0347791.1 ABC transporter permease [Anaerolineales bacterium]
MRPRWRKVLHDLWDNKSRTLLVVLSIAVGVFSIGVIAGAYQIIGNDMGVSYAANNPSNIELRMANFDQDVLDNIRNMRGIADAEARRVINFRARTTHSDAWISLDVIAFKNFKENKINLLKPVMGASEAKKDEILLDKRALEKFDFEIGEYIILELSDGTTKQLKIVGVVQDSSSSAGDFLAPSLGFISMKTMPTLHQPEDLFNRAYVTLSEGVDDLDYIHEAGADIKDKLERNGTDVIRTRFSEKNKYPLADIINAVLGILMALGILIVFLSSSLIANTLDALLSQHLRHIGVIKLVGGRGRQVFAMYVTLIMAFSFLALLVAIPAGGWGAYRLAEFMAEKLRFNLLGYRIVPLAFVIQVVIGLLVPLIAGVTPVINGSRITVLRALSGDIAGDENKPHKHEQERISWFDWMLVRLTNILARRGIHFPRPFIISIRNTFRRRGRLMLTLFTLTMGGAIFIAVFNVRITLHDYMNDIGKYFRADVTLDFDKPYRIREVEQFALQNPDVVSVEGWQFLSFELLNPDGTVAENINVFAPPSDSKLIEPIMVAGRWMRSTDVRKLLLSEKVLDTYPSLKPGDPILLKINGHEETWEVIGLFKFVGQEGVFAYIPLEYAAQITNLPNRSSSFRVVTMQHDRTSQDLMAEKLDRFFRDEGFKVRKAESGLASLDSALESLDILVAFLLIMAVLTAIVGAMGLTGTMGMNVLERTREIGIMRAIGADDRAVMRTIIAEGFVIGTLSFILAIGVSIPFTYGLSYIVSLAVFETPIDVVFTFLGYAIWFGLVLLLSVIGSILPARSAARLTIREVLAYE